MEKIKLNKSDGTFELAEIVSTFKLDKFNNDYVIYNVKGHYYGAKYINLDDKIQLDTNLSDKEKESLSKIFERFHNGGIM